MSVDRNKGIFRWVVFLWLLIHRAKASECFCTLGDSSTPVHSQPYAVSETVGFMESKTCFHGNFVPGMQWLQVDKTDIFISKDSLTACPDGLVKTITAKDFKTLKTEKTTNSRLRKEERRFLLDSLNRAHCDFEVNSICSWRNIQGGHDDFDWVLYQSSTPTDDTGPKFDHTLNNATGSYIFTESSAPRSTLDTAWIQSPEIDAQDVPVHCFRFWYHMFGSSIGRLNIYQVTDGSLPGKLVWSLTGEQGSTWMEGQVPLSSNHNYSMLISGIVGNGYQGDIAIDDVSVSPGYCDVKPSIASRTDVTNTVAGHWSDWANFTACSVTCAGGRHTRNRTCIFDNPDAPHLSECFGNTTDTQDCNTQPCTGIDPNLSAGEHSICIQTILQTCTPNPEEVICGSNGVTYGSFCAFHKAHCADATLKISIFGQCPVASATTTGIHTTTTTAPIISSNRTTTRTTMNTMGPTTFVPTTAITATTTSMEDMIVRVFCHILTSITCNMGFRVTCGSDGSYYPNECELAKASCSKPGLQEMAIIVCGTMVTTTTTLGTTTYVPTTATTATTTSMKYMIVHVFCQNVLSIRCNTGLRVICGSDGLLYRNECELAKVSCSKPGLHEMKDFKSCSI